MKRVCSWCKKRLGTIPGEDAETTHGICAECKAEFEAASERALGKIERRERGGSQTQAVAG